jgi:hypothetical protein
MSNSRGIGFGAFLVGLGAGWLIFTFIDVTSKTFAWILIILGAGIVASGVLRYISPKVPLSGVVSSLSVGLIIALIFTSGLGFIWPWSGPGGPYRYTLDESRNLKGDALAPNLLFRVENVNGQIDVSTWDRPEYNVDLAIKAQGNTEREAQSNLEKVDTTIEENLVQGRLELVLTISVPRLTWSRVSVNVAVTLPADATVDLDIQTTNGGIKMEDLTGSMLTLSTTNGDVAFDGVEADTISASTTNGRISGSVQAADMTADTTNGVISLSLPCTRTGSYGLETTNGNVDVTVVPSGDVGFDLDASTSSGGATLDLSGLTYETSTSRHKVAHTEGYETKPVQIEIDASTTNGNVSVGD